MKKYDVAIIGGGACGLACATSLLKLNSNLSVVLIDACERLGKKLAATGNGQGNVTNEDMSAEHYYGGNVSLVERIACKDKYAGIKLFNSLFVCDSSGRYYPSGKQASALVDNLKMQLEKSKIEIMTAVKVVQIRKGLILELDNGQSVTCTQAVLACGGKAQRQFKTDGSAYSLATALGHHLTPLYPSLVQLKTQTTHIKTLKGIRADCTLTAYSEAKQLKTATGDIIFTEYGVSGNAVFSISPVVVDKPNIMLSVEFLRGITREQIESDILAKKRLGYQTSELLSGTLHNQLGRAIIKRAATDDEREISQLVKNFTLPVTGNLGFDYAQVTKGGVKMDEVTDELESKFVKGLYFGGEVLDVDGDCGGYNLHWAFTSGIHIAQNIAKKYD